MKLCGFEIGLDKPFFLMAGPCVIESEEMVMAIAREMKAICDELGIHYIFKASYDKANRTSVSSFRGPGLEKGLEILARVRETVGVPVVTDVHTEMEVPLVARYVDVLQTPAFLCRQTDFICACARTGKPVNIKKGQFLSPSAMKFAAEKVARFNDKIILTDRGTQFGYSDLIIDFRGIPQMQQFGYPVVLDVTHSLQQPNQNSGVTGGLPQMIGTMARAGVAAGVDGLFFETHPEPAMAKSDGANMLRLDKMESMLKTLIPIRKAILNQ